MEKIMKKRVGAALGAIAILAAGSYGLTTWWQSGQTEVLYDSETRILSKDVPHELTPAEYDLLFDQELGQPPPPGFTLDDYSHAKSILTGYVDQQTGESHVIVTLKDHIADIEEVTIKIDGQVFHTASRTGGGGIFDNRGAFTYVTISLMVHLGQVQEGELTWVDAAQNPMGLHAVEF